MKPSSRVLCAVDIDARSNQVLEHAIGFARSQNAELLILHAVSPVLAYSDGATDRVDLLRRLRARADAAGVGVRVEVQQGPADEIILLHARARNVTAIVIGTSRRESRRGLSGWIAERILREAPCPTLVVPESATDPTRPKESVLCAVDFSAASPAVVDEALRRADEGFGRVTLLHVATRHDAGTLDKLQALVPPSRQSVVTAQVIVGQPVTEILRAAHATNAQLLVIGVTDRSALRSRLFGKTGQLLRDATCPVLAVPAASAAHASITDAHRLAA